MKMSTPFWLYWLDIALAHMQEALRCRGDAARVQAAGGQYGEALIGETRASMVAAVASAACIESFAKTVAIRAGGDSAFRGKAARAVLDVLTTAFAIERAVLEKRLRQLFDDRNSAIHSGETSSASAPHPLGVETGRANAYFTVERAAGAIGLAADLLEECVARAVGGDEPSPAAGLMRARASDVDVRVAQIRECVLQIQGRAGVTGGADSQ
ncbi:hypothetical protein O0235_11515 [Tepidiforma flava]|uniref:Apea-like HEPN domain-containing protein n=1 Tax=Tepidiforma flava TaxID=3004094 RepID=A0ABY7M4V6_9CHLR|nr:hypothetical protein [Tepidiforma flava]WBL35400.1 hypothetical protein O0235_11515 [Tepidiforma flava]